MTQERVESLNWKRSLETLARCLSARFQVKRLTTEDTVRYYWFDALREQQVPLEAFSLEVPHPNMEKLKVDCYVTEPWGPAWLEVKYDRPIPSGKNLPETQRLGALLADAFKLSPLNGKRILLYVAEAEMRRYFRNRWKTILDSTEGNPFVPSLAALPPTARKAINKQLKGVEENLDGLVAIHSMYVYDADNWMQLALCVESAR